jgi:hypothetical protein
LEEKIDKRSFKRIQRKFIMRVAVDDGNPWPRWSLVTTHNLSAGGALFTFDQPVKEGERLRFKLHFLDREIDCSGSVIRFEPGSQKPLVHMAVSFDWKNEKDREFIEEFSRNHPSET